MNNNYRTKYYRMDIYVIPKQNIHYSKTSEKLGEIINESMLYNKETRALHKENKFKGYVYGNLTPIEKDKYYKKNKPYLFPINSIDKEILTKLIIGLSRVQNPYFEIICLGNIKTIKNWNLIKRLYTITPAIATLYENNKVSPLLLNKNSIESLQERIIQNAKKKYKQFYHKEKNVNDFIKGIKITSKIPIVTYYKSMKMLGYKMEIYVGESMESQELANICLACGVLEKNSCLGSGFVRAHYKESDIYGKVK